VCEHINVRSTYLNAAELLVMHLPKMSALSVSVASRVVKPTVKEMNQLLSNGSAWGVSYGDTTKPAEQNGKRTRIAAYLWSHGLHTS